MRSKNAFKNLAFSLGFEVVIFVIGLIVPRLIILSYGDSINGLTQTITRLLALINLIQSGAVGASIYQMYKPVAEGDYETQSAILYSSRRHFHRLGYIYLCIAVVVSIFYGFYLEDAALKPLEIILGFAVLAISGSLYFFYTALHDIFLSPHQKKYYLTLSSFFERIVYYVLLFIVVYLRLHFIFMYVALLIAGIVRVTINSSLYRKLSKGKISDNPKEKHYPIKDRKYLMLASIGGEAVMAAPTVIITTFIGLAYSSVFSIYAMIYISMKTIINSLQLAVSAIFGNLVATSNDNKVAEVFNILIYMFIMLGVILASCTAFMFMPFIDIYTDGFTGVSYYYPILAVFIVAYVAIFAFKTGYGFVATVYGLFRDTYNITLTTGLMGVVLSTICVIMFGMPYVMIGVLFFHLSGAIVYLIIFKKKISWFTLYKVAQRVFILVTFPALSYGLYKYLGLAVTGWLQWFVTATTFALIIIAVLVIYSLFFERKEVKALINYARKILKKSK